MQRQPVPARPTGEPETQSGTLPHNLILEDRRRLTVTGVKKVESCDAFSAVMQTGRGTLTVTGHELSVSALSLETGEVKVGGSIDSIEYTENRDSGGFFRRLAR